MTRLAVACLTLLVAACTGGAGSSPEGGATPGATRTAADPTSTALTSPATPAATSTPEETAPATESPTEPPTGAPTDGPTAAPTFAWSELPQAGDAPGAREDHTWTVDDAGTSAYLFGGRTGSRASDELWRYDLTTDSWTLLAPESASPAPRFGHVAAWVPGVGLVIWSGQAGSDFFSDIWAYDPQANSWTELPAGGDVPPARYGSCGAVGPDGRLWISHGFTGDRGRFDDTRAYDFAAGSWANVTPAAPLPVIRCLHDCLWTPDGRLLLYAGQTTGAPAIGDLWTYQPVDGAWTEGPDPEPPPRQLYALASVDERAFVFGGGSRDGGVLDDLWLLDLTSLAWTELEPAGPGPNGRSGATLIADPERGRLLLFGGKGEAELGELWQLEADL